MLMVMWLLCLLVLVLEEEVGYGNRGSIWLEFELTHVVWGERKTGDSGVVNGLYGVAAAAVFNDDILVGVE